MDKCTHCPIRTNCDWLSFMCRLSDKEVAQRFLKPTRAEYLRRYDANRRQQRIDERRERDNNNVNGVFARRRIRQRAKTIGV